jgi:hypothetical protein
MKPGDDVPGAGLRRFAERTFDRSTVETVILPALADLQHECASTHAGWLRRFRTSLRAYWELWKTIGICARRRRTQPGRHQLVTGRAYRPVPADRGHHPDAAECIVDGRFRLEARRGFRTDSRRVAAASKHPRGAAGAGLNKFGYPAAYGTWTANGAFLVIGLRVLRSRGRYVNV